MLIHPFLLWIKIATLFSICCIDEYLHWYILVHVSVACQFRQQPQQCFYSAFMNLKTLVPSLLVFSPNKITQDCQGGIMFFASNTYQNIVTELLLQNSNHYCFCVNPKACMQMCVLQTDERITSPGDYSIAPHKQFSLL